MITKLKWLSAFWQRDPIPANGGDLGLILYTEKTDAARRRQVVIDLDARTATIQTIDGEPADRTTQPNPEDVTDTIFPTIDDKLVIFGVPRAITCDNVSEFLEDVDGIAGVTDQFDIIDAMGPTMQDINLDEVDVVFGENATLSLVSGDPQLRLDVGSATISVLPDTPVGTYSLTYRISAKDDPGQHADYTYTVDVVVFNAIVATNDNISVSAAEGITGVPNVINVLTNDTLDGAPAVVPDVTIKQLSLDSHLTFDKNTGNVTLLPGVGPGSYQLTYYLSERAVPINISNTATVTVTVNP